MSKFKSAKKATIFKEPDKLKPCGFELWNGSAICGCGAPGFGCVGRTNLCEEHFKMAVKLKGISDFFILDLRE